MEVNMTEIISNKEEKPKRPYDDTQNKYRGYRYVWELYPGEGWDEKKWGPAPVLGYSRADTEFDAVYAGYDKGFIAPNSTFEVKARKATKFVKNI
jgi:hypothetical protein